MNTKELLKYFVKCKSVCDELSDSKGIFRLYTYYDYIKCLIVYGCSIRQYRNGGLYKIKRVERNRRITSKRYDKLFYKLNNRDSIHYLENKQEFNKYFEKFVKRSWLYSYEMSFEDFNNLCSKASRLIVKPSDGVEGQGVYSLDVPTIHTNLEVLYLDLRRQKSMIEEFISQHEQMALGVKSINTIRVHSILGKHGEVTVFKPCLRVGVGDSIIDNYAAGGCIYEVDVESGIVISKGYSKSGKQYIFHPGTDICMIGFQVPLWHEIVKTVRSAAKSFPYCRFIGWDVAISKNGVELIEGNHNPDYELLEFFGQKGWYDFLKAHI